MPQTDYNVNINIKAKDSTSQATKPAAKGLAAVAQAAQAVAGAMVVRKVAQYAAELTQLGATAQRHTNGQASIALTRSARPKAARRLSRRGRMQPGWRSAGPATRGGTP